MNPIHTFFWGCLGSIAVEIVTINRIFSTKPARIPEQYRSAPFWIVRILLAVIGGCLAVAYEIDKPILAANIGAATPLLTQALAQGFGRSLK